MKMGYMIIILLVFHTVPPVLIVLRHQTVRFYDDLSNICCGDVVLPLKVGYQGL